MEENGEVNQDVCYGEAVDEKNIPISEILVRNEYPTYDRTALLQHSPSLDNEETGRNIRSQSIYETVSPEKNG